MDLSDYMRLGLFAVVLVAAVVFLGPVSAAPSITVDADDPSRFYVSNDQFARDNGLQQTIQDDLVLIHDIESKGCIDVTSDRGTQVTRVFEENENGLRVAVDNEDGNPLTVASSTGVRNPQEQCESRLFCEWHSISRINDSNFGLTTYHYCIPNSGCQKIRIPGRQGFNCAPFGTDNDVCTLRGNDCVEVSTLIDDEDSVSQQALSNYCGQFDGSARSFDSGFGGGGGYSSDGTECDASPFCSSYTVDPLVSSEAFTFERCQTVHGDRMVIGDHGPEYCLPLDEFILVDGICVRMNDLELFPRSTQTKAVEDYCSLFNHFDVDNEFAQADQARCIDSPLCSSVQTDIESSYVFCVPDDNACHYVVRPKGSFEQTDPTPHCASARDLTCALKGNSCFLSGLTRDAVLPVPDGISEFFKNAWQFFFPAK
jgi:hypothetical protein